MKVPYDKKYILAGALCIILLAVAFSQLGFPDVGDSEGVCDGCNVVLFSIEPLQKDHLGIYNYHRNTTPYLDKLAKNSTVFQNAYTTSGHTLPATASTLTSKYPSQHEINTFIPQEERTVEDYESIAGVLNERGYTTIAVDDRMESRSTAGIEDGYEKYFDGYSNKSFKDALEIGLNGEEPFFAYFQTFQTHTPYSMNVRPQAVINSPWIENETEILQRREEWLDILEGGNESAKLVREHVDEEYRPEFINNESFRETEISAYDASIRNSDKSIKNIIEKLEEAGIRDDTIIIFMGQHGELLGEHDTVGHPTLYEEVINIPLLIHTPGDQINRSEEYVMNLDIKPTILHLLGEYDTSLEYIRGSSLVQHMTGEDFGRDLVFSEHNLQGPAYTIIDTEKNLKYFNDPNFNQDNVYNISRSEPEKRPVNQSDLRTYMRNFMDKHENVTGYENPEEELWPYFG